MADKKNTTTNSPKPGPLPDAKTVGKRLRQIRERLSLTIGKLGEETGVSVGYISDFENGNKLPSSKFLTSLLLKYNISIDYIISGKGQVSRANDPITKLLEFGILNEKIFEMLKSMKQDDAYLYNMLLKFAEYKKENPLGENREV